MLPRKRRAFLRLHQAPRRVPIHILWGPDPNITRTLLHDDAENDSLLDAELRGFNHGVVDAPDVFVAVARLQHLGLVEVEERVEVFPGVLAGEGGGGAGVVGEAHCEGFEGDRCGAWVEEEGWEREGAWKYLDRWELERELGMRMEWEGVLLELAVI